MKRFVTLTVQSVRIISSAWTRTVISLNACDNSRNSTIVCFALENKTLIFLDKHCIHNHSKCEYIFWDTQHMYKAAMSVRLCVNGLLILSRLFDQTWYVHRDHKQAFIRQTTVYFATILKLASPKRQVLSFTAPIPVNSAGIATLHKKLSTMYAFRRTIT